MTKISLFIADEAGTQEGQRLAEKLGLSLTTDYEQQTLVLVLTKDRLELHFPDKKMKPLFVDFLAPVLAQRLQRSHGRVELIAKAVGMKADYAPSVIDTTAGLGKDSLILAHLGCAVHMIERSPIICALLQDGLERAQKANPVWLANLVLSCEDSRLFLKRYIELGQFADVVLIDPMFPARVKSALVKKEMRILKEVVGSDDDSSELFYLAIKCAKKRVVVKRPRHADRLVPEVPSVVYEAKASRFDVYITSPA